VSALKLDQLEVLTMVDKQYEGIRRRLNPDG
jgi:hypothetical protein